MWYSLTGKRRTGERRGEKRREKRRKEMGEKKRKWWREVLAHLQC